jgi:hypothetical protein
MERTKRKLIRFAAQNQKEDIKANYQYWNEVMSDIKKCNNEVDLLKIAQFEFGFETLDEVNDD